MHRQYVNDRSSYPFIALFPRLGVLWHYRLRTSQLAPQVTPPVASRTSRCLDGCQCQMGIVPFFFN